MNIKRLKQRKEIAIKLNRNRSFKDVFCTSIIRYLSTFPSVECFWRPNSSSYHLSTDRCRCSRRRYRCRRRRWRSAELRQTNARCPLLLCTPVWLFLFLVYLLLKIDYHSSTILFEGSKTEQGARVNWSNPVECRNYVVATDEVPT